MKKLLFTFLFLFQHILGFSQFTDDFSDGNFTINPSWKGDTALFEIDSNLSLHLTDTISNTSYLYTNCESINNASWEFDIKLDFSPSTSNYAKIYLTSDQQNLTSNLNGYFLKVGGQSGAVDDISLYIQNGNSETKIIDGTDGIAANNPELRIKVTRDNVGNWEMYLDTSNTYFLDGSSFNNSIISSNYFGIYCKYTSTRGDKFWFDNFVVSGTADTTTPQIINQNDIVINEIFVDPTPIIGLPEYEYIELYNNTNSSINLTNWTISIGTSVKEFPPSIIEADSFVILVKNEVIDSFPNNISRIGFSSISLTNGGDNIILKDNFGRTINAISYTDKWYNNNNRSEGGWSIERVNPNLFCEGKNNWRASVANIGGTPGKENSVLGSNIYPSDFRITNAYITTNNKVKVFFSKSIDSLQLANHSFFDINGNILVNSNPVPPFFNTTILTANFNFLENEPYTISTNGLYDCTGNYISNSIQFGITDSVLENEIIINEVLFNPKDNGVDYVEIYNNSNSFFDLSKLKIANFFSFGGQNYPENPKTITEETIIFSPKSYLVLTADTSMVKQQYFCENPYNFIELEGMPTLSNDSGNICITHQSLNQIIDAFSYSDDMHFSLLESTDGVSLERLSFNDNDWHSAASTTGFGTPTYKNSQKKITESIGEVNIEPKSFSPNNDGNKDICTINWNFNETNLMATIHIFDDEGRKIKNILNNKMIGNFGNAIWDGTSEDGEKLNSGIYIVWLQVFSENGKVNNFKKAVVLSR